MLIAFFPFIFPGLTEFTFTTLHHTGERITIHLIRLFRLVPVCPDTSSPLLGKGLSCAGATSKSTGITTNLVGEP